MSSYLVKVRGEARGPYSAAQLQTQIRRKRLSRQHQVSPDGGVSWVRAGELSALFPADPPVMESVVPADPPPRPAEPVEMPQEPEQEPRWSYSVLGQQLGPLPESEIRLLIASGGIERTTLMWQDGMTDWVELQHIPTFSAAVRSRQSANPHSIPGPSDMTSLHSERTLHWPSLASFVLALASLTVTIPGALMALGGSASFRGSDAAPALVIVGLSLLPGLLFAITSVTVGHTAQRYANREPGRFDGATYAVFGLVLGYIVLLATICVGLVSLVSIAK